MVTARTEVVRRLIYSVIALAGVVVGGAIGYYIIGWRQDWTVVDALYMSVITVATVGFQEVHELDQTARIFTVILILCGVGAFTFTITSIGNYLIAGELRGFLEERRMEKEIDHLVGHYILCGYGRMGHQVADEFRREDKTIVVVDRSEEAVARAREDGFLALHGDAGDDDTLRQLGIEKARALVTSIDDDATNVMVVLSARAMNDRLVIVSRANHHETAPKLSTAGADRVLWPYGVSGRRLAQMALRPYVVEFLELVMHDEELELLLEEVKVALGAALEGIAISASRIREHTGGAMIVALRQRSGKMLVAPRADTVLQAGDIAVALGTMEQLQRLRELATLPAHEK